jgi:predicted transcriptional regulator of viral defense system
LTKKTPVFKALSLAIENTKLPIITLYQVSVLLCELYFAKVFQGNKVDIRRLNFPDRAYLFKQIRSLDKLGILHPNKNFPKNSVYSIFGRQIISPEETVCFVDPFAYISHLSAMEYHGLTDRLPNDIFYSTPPPKEWKEFAQKKMYEDCKNFLDEYITSGLPLLTKIAFTKINKRPIRKYSSIHQGAFKNIKDRYLRVSTIGRTFLDMLREPRFCGGINHVIDIFKKYGPQYKDLIISEFDRQGNLIEKARVGFILEEFCKITDQKIEAWALRVQRGGSRKLDPYSEYNSNYSERWCLSINNE